MTNAVKQTTREAESSPLLHGLARAGFAADGVVHLLVAGLVFAVAAGAGAESDQSAAFAAIAQLPFGLVLLWALAVALWALAAYYLLDAVITRAPTRAKTWGRRLGVASKAIAFGALGGISAAVALGSRAHADDSARQASGGVLAMPGGPLLLAALGLGVVVAGIVFVVLGVGRRFRKLVQSPPRPLGTVVTVLGVVGYVGKGISLALIGILLTIAAVRVDPQAAGGLNGAIKSLLRLPFGEALVVAVGVGLAAYGVFLGFRARYARL